MLAAVRTKRNQAKPVPVASSLGGRLLAVRIFISHAASDAKLAETLVQLIEAGIEAPEGAIRCTSVDGYKLEGGDSAAEALRENLRSCDVVVGILTSAGLRSSYVLMELGAAWGFQKTAVPVLAPGISFDALPGPFRDVHALRLDHAPELATLISTVARRTALLERRNAAKVQVALAAVARASAASPLGPQPGAPSNPVPDALAPGDDLFSERLRLWTRRHPNNAGAPQAFRYRVVDDAANVPVGTTKRLIKAVINESHTWRFVSCDAEGFTIACNMTEFFDLESLKGPRLKPPDSFRRRTIRTDVDRVLHAIEECFYGGRDEFVADTSLDSRISEETWDEVLRIVRDSGWLVVRRGAIVTVTMPTG